MSSEWMNFFANFFDENSKNIGVVMYADGCREGWLQGEIFRQSMDKSFKVNSYRIGRGRAVDLYGEKPTRSSVIQRMVGEIKIIATSFPNKNIAGESNISQFTGKDTVLVTQRHLDSVNQKEGSLLKDVSRLRSITDRDVERYMILVIPEYDSSKVNVDLKKALFGIQLSNEYIRRDYPDDHFSVRIWRL